MEEEGVKTSRWAQWPWVRRLFVPAFSCMHQRIPYLAKNPAAEHPQNTYDRYHRIDTDRHLIPHDVQVLCHNQSVRLLFLVFTHVQSPILMTAAPDSPHLTRSQRALRFHSSRNSSHLLLLDPKR